VCVDRGLCDLGTFLAVTRRSILHAADGWPVAGLLGCPPCQGWSAAGHRAAVDGRNELLKDFFRLVNSVYPAFFVMENVPSVADRRELATALATLRNRYGLWQGVLNAAAYGLPQSRQRVLVIGYRQKDSGHGRSKHWLRHSAPTSRSPASIDGSSRTADAWPVRMSSYRYRSTSLKGGRYASRLVIEADRTDAATACQSADGARNIGVSCASAGIPDRGTRIGQQHCGKRN